MEGRLWTIAEFRNREVQGGCGLLQSSEIRAPFSITNFNTTKTPALFLGMMLSNEHLTKSGISRNHSFNLGANTELAVSLQLFYL